MVDIWYVRRHSSHHSIASDESGRSLHRPSPSAGVEPGHFPPGHFAVLISSATDKGRELPLLGENRLQQVVEGRKLQILGRRS